MWSTRTDVELEARPCTNGPLAIIGRRCLVQAILQEAERRYRIALHAHQEKIANDFLSLDRMER